MPSELEILDLIRATIREEIHPHVMSIEVHAEQHEFITAFIATTKAKAARRERMQEKIAGSLLLAFLLGLVGLIGAGALQWVRTGMIK